MRGKVAKELRKIAGFKVSYDPAIKNSAEYLQKKEVYKNLKKIHKEI